MANQARELTFEGLRALAVPDESLATFPIEFVEGMSARAIKLGDATSWFDLLLKSGETIRLRGLPRFVRTRGGAYTFLPSISAIRYLGSLGK